MVTMEELLGVANEMGASDVHISVGISPKVRLDGSLIAMDYPVLQPEDTEALTLSITSNYHRQVLEETGEVDYSYSIPNLGRYRVNIFKQRGTYAAAIRLVDTVIPTPSKLRMYLFA